MARVTPFLVLLWLGLFQAYLFLPLLEEGLDFGMDVSLHLGNAVEAARLLEEKLPPWDWTPDVAGGHGGPNYIFYGHLAFLLPGALIRLGLDPPTAIKVLVGVGLVVVDVPLFPGELPGGCRCPPPPFHFSVAGAARRFLSFAGERERPA
jgi:hypothetical protein